MKKIQCKTLYQSLAFAALLMGGVSLASAQTPDLFVNSFDNSSQLQAGANGGSVWFGTATLTWDGTQDNITSEDDTNVAGGSAFITTTMGSDQANGDSPLQVALCPPPNNLFFAAQPLNLSQYLNVQFDIKWQNSPTN